MTTAGPYQYCSTCGKERAHNWIAETTYACIGCNKETKVYLRKALEKIGAEVKSPVQEGLSHLDSEALANVQQSMNTIQEKLEEVKEIIEDKGFVTELPKMGHEVKHTPLEPHKLIFIDTEEYNGEPNIQHAKEFLRKPIPEGIGIMKQLDNPPVIIQKGWADGL